MRVAREQLEFILKVSNGYKPGAAALDKALAANQATRVKMARDIKRITSANATAKAVNAKDAEAARKARAKRLFKDEKARKKAEALFKKNEKEYRLAVKQLAHKVANTIDRNNAKLSQKSKRDRLAKLYRELRASIAKKRAAAVQAAALVRVSDVSHLGYFRSR